MKKIFLLFLFTILLINTSFANNGNYVALQSSDGNEISASNPLQVHCISGCGGGNVGIGTEQQEAVFAGTNQGIGTTSIAAGIITDTGTNVGIGSVTPGQKLDVNGTAKVVSLIVNGSGSTYFTGNVGIGSTVPAQTLDVNGTLQHVYVSVAGNIGVGSVNPTRAIDVVGDVNVSGGFRVGGVQMTSISGGNQLVLGPSSATTSTVFNTTNATQMELLGSNLGIGSLAPGQALDVIGTIRVSSATPLIFKNCKSTTGTRYICVDTAGNISCSASACSGT